MKTCRSWACWKDEQKRSSYSTDSCYKWVKTKEIKMIALENLSYVDLLDITYLTELNKAASASFLMLSEERQLWWGGWRQTVKVKEEKFVCSSFPLSILTTLISVALSLSLCVSVCLPLSLSVISLAFFSPQRFPGGDSASWFSYITGYSWILVPPHFSLRHHCWLTNMYNMQHDIKPVQYQI